MKYYILFIFMFVCTSIEAQEKFGLYFDITPPNENGLIIRKHKQCNDLSILLFFDSTYFDSVCKKTSISRLYNTNLINSGEDSHLYGSVFIVPLIDTNKCFNYYSYSIREKEFQQLTFFNPIKDSLLPDYYKKYFSSNGVNYISRDYLSGHVLEFNDSSLILYATYRYYYESLGSEIIHFKFDSIGRFSMVHEIFLNNISPFYYDYTNQNIRTSDNLFRIKMEKTSNNFNFWWIFNFMKFKNSPMKWKRSVDNVYMYTLDSDFSIIKIEEIEEDE